MRLTVPAALLVLVASMLMTLSLRGDSEAAWPGTNGRIVFSDFNHPGIWAMDADGSNRVQLTTGAADFLATWSADASKIVFERGGAGTLAGPQGVDEIWTMDADGGNEQMITFGNTPSWSQNGTRIVFAQAGQIKEIPAGGGTITTITQDAGVIDSYPVYRPGSGTIAFLRTVIGGGGAGAGVQGGGPPVYPDVYTMDNNGGSVDQVTNTPGYLEGAPDWSPDGGKLIFRSTGGDFWTWDFGSPGDPALLLDSMGQVLDFPSYSPDGVKIVYSKGPPIMFQSVGAEGTPASGYTIWTANSNGTNEQQVPGSPADPIELHGDWEAVTATPTASPTASPTATLEPGTETPTGSPTATATASPTATAAPTSPGETAEPTATPGPSPIIQDVVWGDDQCDEEPNPVDSLFTLRFDAGLSTNTGDCPPMDHDLTIVEVLVAGLGGQSPEGMWGNVDCDDETNPVDSLKILRYDAGFESVQEEPCPPIGSDVRISYYLP